MADNSRSGYDIQAILQEMRSEYWRSLEEDERSAVTETHDIIVFRLGNERYGIPSTLAREVLRAPKMVPVPRLPAHIRGIINLRGQILAVSDLRPFLGLPQQDQSLRTQLIVVEAAGFTTALLTDGVEGLRSVETSTIEPITEGLTGFPRDAALGHIATDQGLLILLDLDHIFGREEFIIDQKDGSS